MTISRWFNDVEGNEKRASGCMTLELTEKELQQAYFEYQRRCDLEEANNYVYSCVMEGKLDLTKEQTQELAKRARKYINMCDAYLDAMERCYDTAYEEICKEIEEAKENDDARENG